MFSPQSCFVGKMMISQWTNRSSLLVKSSSDQRLVPGEGNAKSCQKTAHVDDMAIARNSKPTEMGCEQSSGYQ